MGKDRLAQLYDEWYSEPEKVAETIEEEIDDEFLALKVLFKSRGVTVADPEQVVAISEEKKAS